MKGVFCKIMYLYELINPINNNVFYIGYTNDPKRRLIDHIRDKYNPLKDKIIYDIINQNKKPILKVLEICEYKYIDSLKMFKHEFLEVEYIKKYKNFGYKLTNLTKGGGFTVVKPIPVYQFDINLNFIKRYNSLTEAAEFNNLNISKISLALDQRVNKTSGNYYWFTTKDGVINVKKRKVAKKNIPISQYDLNGNFIRNFKSQAEAERLTGVKSKLINKCLTRKSYNQAGGFMWFYQNDKTKIIKYDGRYYKKSVLKFNMNGVLLNEYESITVAAEMNNLKPNNITQNLCGKIKSHGGFIWKYKK